jgi:Tol biopolymer transport system component
MKGIFLYLLFFPAVFLPLASVQAQEAMEKFGKNRLQFKNFNWRYYSTENFDIYFYDEGVELARMSADFLDDEFNRITDLLGYAPYSKTEIFLYNSVKDLQQSNVGVNDNSFDVAGKTDFVKTQIEIAYPGSAQAFKEELLYKISSMLITDMMFGGSLSDMFQNSYLLSLPTWFMDGAARYVAFSWSVEMDDFIRDFLKENRVKNLTRYTGEEAGYIGQSIWNYIGQRYGESYISNILNLTRIIRNEERSISGTLAVSFKNFIVQWQNYYLPHAAFVDSNYEYPPEANVLASNGRNIGYTQVKISPEGNFLAYAKNNNGRYKVVLQDLGKEKEKVLLKGGYKVINQEYDEKIPLISWRDESTLGVISVRYGRYYLWVINVNSGKKIKRELTRINQIRDFDIARGGNLAVLSADRNGNSDLYLISLKRNSIKRITNDFYDDIHPRFVPGTSSIVFSSNRTTDSINVTGQNIDKIQNTFNLFVYNIDSTKNTVHRLTNALSRNIKPLAVDDRDIFYLSDQQGIYNIYRYNLESGVYNQVTNYGSSILDYDVGQNKQRLSMIMYKNQEDRVYFTNSFDHTNNIFTQQTKRQQFLNAKYVAERLRRSKDTSLLDQLDQDADEDRESMDSIPVSPPVDAARSPSLLQEYRSRDIIGENRIDTRNYTFAEEPAADEDMEEDTPVQSGIDRLRAQREAEQGDEDFVDTDNYVFDTDVVKGEDKRTSFLSSLRKLRKERDIIGPLPYETRFSADNVVTSFVIDPLIGFGLKLETQMNDLLEDHKFYGGLLATTDLRSGNFYGEYRYLKHTVDFHGRFERRSIFYRNEIANQKYTYNAWEAGASLPLSVTSRITVSPFFATTNFFDLFDQSVLASPEPVINRTYYGGLNLEFIYDNTTVAGMNLIQGTRAKAGLKIYEGFNDPNRSFSNFFVDLRNYQKIHRELVFATRLFYGSFFGRNKQYYLLGGMDNWMFNSTEISGRNDPLYSEVQVENDNLVFVEYVTSMRGFDYNTFNGHNAMLFNAELRLPLVRYFYRGPIASNFFRNFQLISFFDIGSAWSGASPFARENSLNTEILKPARDETNPFSAVIQNFKYPWLASYGFGVRTTLLGYYVKLDVAYPYEDLKRQSTRLYVTLGYDF